MEVSTPPPTPSTPAIHLVPKILPHTSPGRPQDEMGKVRNLRKTWLHSQCKLLHCLGKVTLPLWAAISSAIDKYDTIKTKELW